MCLRPYIRKGVQNIGAHAALSDVFGFYETETSCDASSSSSCMVEGHYIVLLAYLRMRNKMAAQI
jgi:hypothetical protein